MATKTTFNRHYHWQSKLFQSLVILVATQHLTTKVRWNMAHYGMASMYFCMTFHIFRQKSWENSTIFLVSSVNSTKFPIFWLYFGKIWHQKKMENKNNECILIYSFLNRMEMLFMNVERLSKNFGGFRQHSCSWTKQCIHFKEVWKCQAMLDDYQRALEDLNNVHVF
jgi:hypothetical protein